MAQLNVYFVLFLLMLLNICNSISNNTLLIIISFDGFRYDYTKRNVSPTLNNLRMNSSYPPYMESIFPTKTFPNHFSIATGLYSEVHGVLDNQVFDQSRNKTLHYEYDLFHYNDDIVPLWTLNERAGGGRHSGCMMWPGSNFPYQGILPSHYMVYNESVTYEERIDTLLDWFKHPETPINFGMLYFEQPDLIFHTYGPNSVEVNREIAHVDKSLQYLLYKFENAGLLSQLNIIVLSDHGGQAVKVPENYINLTAFVDDQWYSKYGIPPNLQIYPVDGMELQVLKSLKDARGKKGGNFTTFTLAELPERWHYKYCDRTPPILVTADLGYSFLPNKNYPVVSPEIGIHGYDPKNSTMRAIFMALGPLFKRNYEIEPFQNINIYPLVAHILGLSLPKLKPNGSLSILQNILVTGTASVNGSNLTTYLVSGIITVCALIIFTLFCYRRNNQGKLTLREISTAATYKMLNQKMDEERLDAQELLSYDCDEDFPS